MDDPNPFNAASQKQAAQLALEIAKACAGYSNAAIIMALSNVTWVLLNRICDDDAKVVMTDIFVEAIRRDDLWS